MAMRQQHNQFQQYLQHHHHQQQQQQESTPFRDVFNVDGQISPAQTYFNRQTHPDQSQHAPYIPPFHVEGLAPGPVPAADVSDGGLNLQWNYGLEPVKKRPKEEDFLENNSQISSVDFMQPRSVSTGLGLSLDNGRLSSSGDSPFLAFSDDGIELQLQRQDAEIDRYLKLQGDRLRQQILEKVQANQLQTMSYVEQKFLQKLREKEAEVESINRKNMELEFQMGKLTNEAGTWQQRAQYNETMINTLNLNLQQVYAQQSRDSKEGCGDSEIDDTASCCNGRATDIHLLCKGKNRMKESMMMTCKVCRLNTVCMLLLPCKHLCLCKECESKVSVCPLCESSKYIGMEVYM